MGDYSIFSQLGGLIGNISGMQNALQGVLPDNILSGMQMQLQNTQRLNGMYYPNLYNIWSDIAKTKTNEPLFNEWDEFEYPDRWMMKDWDIKFVIWARSVFDVYNLEDLYTELKECKIPTKESVTI